MLLNNKRVCELVLFFSSLSLYIHHLSRSIYAGDTGLLVSAAVVHGVAHPPGYPLFIFLGGLLTLLPGSPAFLVGLISSVFSAVGIVLYFRISLLLTKKLLVSLIATLTMSVMYLYWIYAEIPEVFGLNNFFIILLIYLAVLYNKNNKEKYLYLLAFCTGLSLTNHLTIVLLFPTLLLLIWPNSKKLFIKKRSEVIKVIGLGILGLLPYSYIVVASLTKPAIDWADISSIRSFVAFVLRERYGTFQAGYFDSPGTIDRLRTLVHYLGILLSQLTLPVIVLGTIGAVRYIVVRSRVVIALVIGFFLIGPAFMLYAGFPLDNAFRIGLAERFMAASAVLFLFFLPFGLDSFATKLGSFFSKPVYTRLFVLIFLLIPIQLAIFNYPKTNLSVVTLGDELGKNYLSPLPRQSILLLASDTSLFNAMYLRYALNYRKDVTILNAVDPGSSNKALKKISSDSTAPHLANQQTAALLKNIEDIDRKYPIFSEVPYKGNTQVTWVPYGLVYELRRNDEKKLSDKEFSSRTEKLWRTMKVPFYKDAPTIAYRNLSLGAIYNTYAWSLWHTGVYASDAYQDYQNYTTYLIKSLSVYPDFHPALASLGTFALVNAKDCNKAIFDLNQALAKDPYNKLYFQLLATAQVECHTDKAKIKNLQIRYSEIFHQDLFKK